MKIKNNQSGVMDPLLIPTIVLGVLTLTFGSLGIWAYVNYNDQKNNVDQKVSAAVSDAKKVQQDEDVAAFAEREKEPYVAFIGPDDLGRVTFNYPKTWDVYNGTNKSGEEYQAYFQKGVVSATNSKTPYQLRVSIESRSYEDTIGSYASLVKKGDLKSSPVSIEGKNGTRLDGNFSKEIQGSMVIYKIRDKTLRVYTESNSFKPDFDSIILKSLTFNE